MLCGELVLEPPAPLSQPLGFLAQGTLLGVESGKGTTRLGNRALGIAQCIARFALAGLFLIEPRLELSDAIAQLD